MFSLELSAQKTKTKKKTKPFDGCILYAEIMPEFPGGEDSLMRFIQDNFKFSNFKLDSNEQIPATIFLEITVTKSGKVNYFSTRKTSNVSLINECKRLASIMPRWKTERAFNGKKIDCNFEVPIKIHLE